jgi:hypothetical protein
MPRLVSQKMGIKEGMRAIFVHAPQEAIEAISLPNLEVAEKLTASFDYIHFFTKSQEELDKYFTKLKKYLNPQGMLWVSWPKKGQLATDLTLPKVIHSCYDHGLVESTCLSINSTWSALKCTHPKKGKVYQNSYGQLKS